MTVLEAARLGPFAFLTYVLCRLLGIRDESVPEGEEKVR